MHTPTTEKPAFEMTTDDPPLAFPPYDTTNRKTYLTQRPDAEVVGGSPGFSSTTPDQGAAKRRTRDIRPDKIEARDALEGIVDGGWAESQLGKVVVWVAIIAVVYWVWKLAGNNEELAEGL
jgi:hypothetical protein